MLVVVVVGGGGDCGGDCGGDSLFIVAHIFVDIVGLVLVLFCYAVLNVFSSFSIILLNIYQ